MLTIYISIGNSDDKLTQFAWQAFCQDVDQAISDAARYVGTQVHGRWYSLPNEPWQNACWCIAIDDELTAVIGELRDDLIRIAAAFRQDSIAWAEATTTFLRRDA